MFDFINFLRTITFEVLCSPEPREDIEFKNDVGEFCAPRGIFTWDDLVFHLAIEGCSVERKTPKSEEQIEKDLLEAERWMEKSRERWIDMDGIEDCEVEAIRLSKKYVVEDFDLDDLFRDAAVEADILIINEEGCFDSSILITKEGWDLVVSRVIKKLQG